MNEAVTLRRRAAQIPHQQVHLVGNIRARHIRHRREVYLVSPIVFLEQIEGSVDFVVAALADRQPRLAGVKRRRETVVVRHIEEARLVRHVGVSRVVKRVSRAGKVVVVTVIRGDRCTRRTHHRSPREHRGVIRHRLGVVIVTPRVEGKRAFGHQPDKVRELHRSIRDVGFEILRAQTIQAHVNDVGNRGSTGNDGRAHGRQDGKSEPFDRVEESQRGTTLHKVMVMRVKTKSQRGEVTPGTHNLRERTFGHGTKAQLSPIGLKDD